LRRLIDVIDPSHILVSTSPRETLPLETIAHSSLMLLVRMSVIGLAV